MAACKLAVEGVNGPVLVDLPEDLQAELVSLPERRKPQLGAAEAAPSSRLAATSSGPGTPVTTPLQGHHVGWPACELHGLRSHSPIPISQSVMREVLRHIRAARRPLLLLGGGCVGCDEVLLNELVEVLGMPVVYTFMGKVSNSSDLWWRMDSGSSFFVFFASFL